MEGKMLQCYKDRFYLPIQFGKDVVELIKIYKSIDKCQDLKVGEYFFEKDGEHAYLRMILTKEDCVKIEKYFKNIVKEDYETDFFGSMEVTKVNCGWCKKENSMISIEKVCSDQYKFCYECSYFSLCDYQEGI